MSETKPLFTILNLTGELSKELREYFAKRQAKVVDPLLEDVTKFEWTHILTKDLHDFKIVETTYQVTKKNIKVISLSRVNDLQNFILYNGKMVFDEKWLRGPIGNFILDKFFLEYAGQAFEENYPKFEEKGSFNVVNAFNTSEYLDRLIYDAYKEGSPALSIKTYFDHILMYITGLKNLNKAGFPVEVTYGVFDEIYGLQIHFFTQNLQVSDITSSLSSSISKTAEEYLLNISVQSTDFFDFTFVNQVNKVVLTALWSKSPAIKNDQRGFTFSQIDPKDAISLYPNETISPLVAAQPEIEDLSDIVRLPSAEPEPEAVTTLAPDQHEKETSQKVKGQKEEAETSQLVKGQKDEQEKSQLVKGTKEEADKSSKVIAGDKAETKDVVSMVKGKFEEQTNGVTKISGNKEERVADHQRVSGNQFDQGTKSGQFNFTNLPSAALNDGIEKEKAPFFKQEASLREKMLANQLQSAIEENEALKSRILMMTQDLRSAKEKEFQLEQARRAAEAAAKAPREDKDLQTREEMQQRLSEPKPLNNPEMEKLKALMEREAKLIDELKIEEVKNKRLIIEGLQKETLFNQELEKTRRESASKTFMVQKTKDVFTKLVERKDQELKSLKSRFDQLNKALASNLSQTQGNTVKDLEKQNANLVKMNEIYKEKLTSIATTIEAAKGDDSSKEESRRIGLLNGQLKNQADILKREITKLTDKSRHDFNIIQGLRQDKTKLEEQLAKFKNEGHHYQNSSASDQGDQIKRLQSQNQNLETQFKDSLLKIRELERKLLDANKASKAQSAATAVDEPSKGKVSNLEASVKKLTSDLSAAHNAVADAKKEMNKMKTEKVALQNQVERLKKELEKMAGTPQKKSKAS